MISRRSHAQIDNNLKHLIQMGLLLILAVMPFHAFLSVWLGHIFGHQADIQAWKEVILLALTGLTATLVWRDPERLQRLRQPWVILAAAFVTLALIVTIFNRPPLTAIAFGLKTDLEFLLAAIIATLVANQKFLRQAIIIVLAGATQVIGFGLLQIFILPANFLTHFGYGPTTILPYEHITLGTNTLRFASTLGGPNQLGTYLILPLCLSLALALTRRRWWLLALTAGGLIVLIGTYSRGAWIGAAVALVITLVISVPQRLRRPLAISLAAIAVIGLLAASALVSRSPHLQAYLLHTSLTTTQTTPTSDAQHASSLRTGLHDLATGPFGHGLGTAGPATFHAGTTNIIENYYLQMGYETGLLGLLTFITLITTLIIALWSRNSPITRATAAAVIGISLVALVLPAWADSSTALIAWIVAGSLAALPNGSRRV